LQKGFLNCFCALRGDAVGKGEKMKLIKFDLSIDGVKVKDINELRDHFTPEILAHYRSGVLAKWLMTRKYQDELTALASLEDGDDHSLLKALCHVFQIDADERVIAEALREVRPAAVVAMSGQESSRLKFALSINGKRVSRLDDLRANFTIEVLGHYRNGLLSEWLHSHGLTQELAAVNAIDESDDHLILKNLSRIFAVETDDRLIAEALKTDAQTMSLEPCPGTAWIEPLTRMVFVWIPSGCCLVDKSFMPQDTSGQDRIAVCVRGFWMGQSPVTYAQWENLMRHKHYQSGSSSASDIIRYLDKYDVEKFVSQLNFEATEKNFFRVPSVVELYYAHRGGFPVIDNETHGYRNYERTAGTGFFQIL
jgi:formylglycine-generating enzyme required for sulfatase activity